MILCNLDKLEFDNAELAPDALVLEKVVVVPVYFGSALDGKIVQYLPVQQLDRKLVTYSDIELFSLNDHMLVANYRILESDYDSRATRIIKKIELDNIVIKSNN